MFYYLTRYLWKDSKQMSCILSISGVNFRVDEFITVTGMLPYVIYRKGDHNPRKNSSSNIHLTSGCRFDASISDFDQFDKQKLDVIEFLKKNAPSLSRLHEFGLLQNEYPYLDFAIETQMLYEDVYVQSNSLEPELLSLAGNLNIEICISQYPPATDK